MIEDMKHVEIMDEARGATLSLVSLSRIFSVHHAYNSDTQESGFVLTECCDEYFSVFVRTHELVELAVELIKAAGSAE